MAGKDKQQKRNFWFTITNAKKITPEEYRATVNKVITFVAVVFGASVLVFLGVALFGGFGAVYSIITSSNLSLYVFAFISVFIGYLISFGKWSYYMKRLKIKVPLLKNLAVYLSMYSMELTPGRVGRVFTAYTLNRITKIRFVHIMPIVTMDIVTDFFGAAAVALLASIYFNKYVLIVLIGVVISLLPSLFILNDWFFKFVKNLMKKSKYFETFTLYGEEYFASQSKLNTWRVYLVSMFFTIPSAIFYSLSLYFSLLAVGITAPPAGGTILIYYAAQIIGTMTSLPGNVGVTDGAMVAMLGSIFNLQSAISSAVTIMTRIASLWFGVILGGIFLLYTLRYWNLSKEELRRLERNRAKA